MCDITSDTADDGEDGWYIDYRDLHEKIHNKPNSPEEPVLIKHPSYNNGLTYDKHLELNSHINEIFNNSNPTIVMNLPLPNQEKVYYVQNEQVRKFNSGATRDQDNGKIDFEGFLSPLVLHRYFEYMHQHRNLPNGDKRDSDNWQLLFGDKHLDVCIKSLLRHVFDLWLHHRKYSEKTTETLEDSICAIIFNANAYLFKLLLDKKNETA